MGTIVNRTSNSLAKGRLEITSTVPLAGHKDLALHHCMSGSRAKQFNTDKKI